jgi:hypothetical protein
MRVTFTCQVPSQRLMKSTALNLAHSSSMALSLAFAGIWLFALVGCESIWAQAATSGFGTREPVLVELFTSEGCSSCPPADELLARLDSTQFVPGAQAIVLSEHVTYWNQLGWRDPFSMDAMTDRQHHYAAQFGLDSVYTPQVVVDGAAQIVGSDSGAMSRQVARAAEKPKTEIKIEDAKWQGETIQFAVRAMEPSGGVLLVALAADATQTLVSRGENAGRTLHHVAVVRVLKEMGRGVADGRTLTLKLGSKDSTADQSKTLRIVAFLTDSHSGRVLGVAECPVAR